MRAVLDAGDDEVEIDVDVVSGAATAGDLGRAIADPALLHDGPVSVLLDGRPVPGDAPLAGLGLRPGCRLAVHRPPPAAAARPVPGGAAAVGGDGGTEFEVRIVGGLDAGRSFALPPGGGVVGRAADADAVVDVPTVSARHAEVLVRGGKVEVRAATGATNGLSVAGEPVAAVDDPGSDRPIELGAAAITVGPAPAPDPAHLGPVSPEGTRAFHRPPPAIAPPAPEPVPVPDPPPPPSPRVRFSWAAALAPLVLGLALAYLFGPLMAAFALLSPVMAVAGWIEDRRRHQRATRTGSAEEEAGLALLASRLAAAAGVETERRRALLPDLAECVRRATVSSHRLWPRRRGHEAFGLVRLGTGTLGWSPPVSTVGPARDRVRDVLTGARLEGAPVGASLAAGHTVGLAGPRAAVLALARSLVLQLSVHHGPADLRLACASALPQDRDWAWACWLPHTQLAGTGTNLVASGPSAVERLAGALADAGPDDPVVVVVDDPGLVAGRRAPLAPLAGAGRSVGWLVLARDLSTLPAGCTCVVVVDEDGWAEVRSGAGDSVDGFLVAGLAEPLARDCAIALAGLSDPETVDATTDLPGQIRLLDLLDLADATADDLDARWRAARGRGLRLAAPIGVVAARRGGADPRPLVLDLVADGPHALVGGTTGSGKSELLRTLVASLAASFSPDEVTFVLVDYKGGAAFAACAGFPHVLGVVTDLDAHLCRRALRSLEAELRHRERVLAGLGVRDLGDHPAYAGDRSTPPLPQLVVVVDEFGVLAGEQPEFLEGLVAVAVRGRSLGMHLVLGTQRPSGVVSPVIRANTNCRVALRVQDAADSVDVVGVDDASRIDRRSAGRGLIRLGDRDVASFQTALCTGARRVVERAPVVVRPAAAGPPPAVEDHLRRRADDSDLAALVSAARAAAVRSGRPAPRRPWVEALPTRLGLDDPRLAGRADGGGAPVATVGLVDDPDHQAQHPWAWDAGAGNLLVLGAVGSGAGAALPAVATALAASYSPDRLHLYALDHGNGGLGPLADLPHTGAVVGAGEVERTHRLVELLAGELEERRALATCGGLAGRPRVVLLVENVGGLRAAFDDLAGLAVLDGLERVAADGPGLGIHVVLGADRPGSVPAPLAASAGHRLVLRLADPQDLHLLGLGGVDRPPAWPGRGLDAGTGLEVQLAEPAPIEAVRTRWGAAAQPPRPVRALPTTVARSRLDRPRQAAGEVALPLGVGGAGLATRSLVLRRGDHALVIGPGRSGKSTALATVASAALDAGVAVTAVVPRPSPLADLDRIEVLVGATGVAAAVERVTASAARCHLLVVDDAEWVPASTELEALVTDPPPGVHVVAAARPDALRSLYGHWTSALRRSQLGIVLRPASELDGDLLGVPVLPRSVAPPVAGRGWLVGHGQVELVQVAS